MTPADRAALEIGRLFMRVFAAEQQVAALVKDLEALKAEHASDPRLDPSTPQAV